MILELEKVQSVWSEIKDFVSVPHNEKQYRKLVRILDQLMDEIGNNEKHPLAPLMETIGNLIESYENNKYTPLDAKPLTPIEILKYLMEEHNLTQKDMIELGSQGVVSEILSGKRQLNVRQIKSLSKRFSVSPAVFI